MIERVEAIKKVIEERIRQNQKWGYPQQNTPFEWLSILTEEVGEFAEALNNALLGQCPLPGGMERAIDEIIQVAAVAVSIIEHLSKSDPQESSESIPVQGVHTHTLQKTNEFKTVKKSFNFNLSNPVVVGLKQKSICAICQEEIWEEV